MVKVKINKEEIESMLKDQLKCEEIVWNEDGSVSVEIELDKIKEMKQSVYVDRIKYVDRPIFYPTTNPQLLDRDVRWTISDSSTTSALTYGTS